MLKFSTAPQIWKKYIQKLNDWDLPLSKDTSPYRIFLKAIPYDWCTYAKYFTLLIPYYENLHFVINGNISSLIIESIAVSFSVQTLCNV